MKKLLEKPHTAGKLRLSGEAIRVLATSDLRMAAGGSSTDLTTTVWTLRVEPELAADSFSVTESGASAASYLRPAVANRRPE